MHPFSTPAEVTPEQGLAWGKGVPTDFPADLTVPEIFAQQVALRPGAVAVRDGDTSWSYAELAAHAARAAKAVTDAGCEPHSFIALPARRSAGFVAAALGVLQAGHAYLPLDEDEPAERQGLRKHDCAGLLRWTSSAEPSFSFEKLSGASAGNFPDRAGSPAYLLYTSGSTGRPKGVVVPHRAIARLVCATDYLQLGPDDVVAFHSNLSFDASTLELWGPLLNGGSLVVTPTETVLAPDALEEHLRCHEITTLWLTTSLLAQLAQERPALFARLRNLIFGGEAANTAAVRLLCAHGPPENLINGYGPTESTTFAVCHRVNCDAVADRLPIGRPIANTDAFVLDEQMQSAAEGELYLGGAGLALGYHRAPELTAERFLETRHGRLYRTGDLARWRADGTLDYLGRRDRQVKIRGFRIEPGEIEAALRAVPGVAQAAVVLKHDPAGDPCLVGYFTGPVEADEIRRELRQRLPAAFVPAALVQIERLPLTANGKLDEAALPPPFQARSAAAGASNFTALEQTLANAWAEVLGTADLPLDGNFFDLGGTSLSLLRVYRELHAQTELRALRVVDLFQHPTLRSLARFLERGRVAPAAGGTQARAEKQRAALARRRLLSKT
jgi:amino acid adenylation domain-containing protein